LNSTSVLQFIFFIISSFRVHIRDYVRNLVDGKLNASLVFMDLQKAFDTVCVERLLNCLENYGFRGTVLNLFKSFLSDRRQVIKIGSTLSHAANENVRAKVCHDMEIIIDYLNYQRLFLNIEKTKFMIVHTPTMKVDNINEISVQVKSNKDNESITYNFERIYKMKYLGLIIDEFLKWDDHIESIKSKLANAAGILWKLRIKD